jgi:hypothetical protein
MIMTLPASFLVFLFPLIRSLSIQITVQPLLMPGKWKTPEERIQVVTLLKEGMKIKDLQDRFPNFSKSLLYNLRNAV